MKIDKYKIPNSSFFSIEKDLEIIISKFLKDEPLKKMLKYTTRDALRQPNLSEADSYALLGGHIKITPKFEVDPEVRTYVAISFDNFHDNQYNPEFRNNAIIFDIVCNHEQWQLENYQLRPFRIAAEIDTIMKNTQLTNLGKMEFAACNQVLLNETHAGVTLMYNVIHGGEDSHLVPSGDAAEEQAFI